LQGKKFCLRFGLKKKYGGHWCCPDGGQAQIVYPVVLLNIIPSCDESVVVKVEIPLQTPFEDYADSYDQEVDSLDKKEQLEDDEDEQLTKR
jgi:hypothetical protein